MASEISEVKTYFGRCRCCLNYSYLKNMWSEYRTDDGGTEIYGNMIMECFSLSWVRIGGVSESSEQVCGQCIKRLRDAVLFKQMVENSHESFMDLVFEKPLELSCEDPDMFPKEEVEASDEEDILVVLDDGDADSYSMDIEHNEDGSQTMESTGEAVEEFEQVEYLDEYINEISPDDRSPKKSRGWPKKLPKSLRYKTYKQYTEDDMKDAIEAVVSESMVIGDAAQAYKVPLNTLKTKVHQYIDDPVMYDVTDSKQYKFIEEIKIVLTYTNATPYKSKAVRYFCAYCGTDGPRFDDGESLRTHTRTQHAADRIKKINFMIRPYWLNEILKLDIENFACTVCSCGLDSWNHMFKHLKQTHDIVLDQAYSRMVPYLLHSELKCALCHLECSNYLILDGHMNAHYSNYICGDCGDTFLALSRLKQHSKIHELGRFPCDHCGKTFTVKKYMQKHIDKVHTKDLKFKCQYCTEKFAGEYLRHLHVVKRHKDKVKFYTCEYCGKQFSWRQYYSTHLKKAHFKKFSCEFCDKKFVTKVELDNHVRLHDSKRYKCQFCDKLFTNKVVTTTHMLEHVTLDQDKSYLCEKCNKIFHFKSKILDHMTRHISIVRSMKDDE